LSEPHRTDYTTTANLVYIPVLGNHHTKTTEQPDKPSSRS